MTTTTNRLYLAQNAAAAPRPGDEVVAGNIYDKYHTANPIARHLMAGFKESFDDLFEWRAGESILEVGCGEGYLLHHLHQRFPDAQMAGLDLSFGIVQMARHQGCPSRPFLQASAYELPYADASWDLVVACEVLEHLEQPQRALEEMRRVSRRGCLVSVPREPFWSLANMLRFKYLGSLGNTPGHVQQWGRRRFTDLVEQYFTVERVANPFPWTMIQASK